MSSQKKSALGRGFEGLIPTGFTVADVASPSEQIKHIPLDKLVANPDQPRKQFDESALHELADSIKEHGIIQPLVATPHGELYRIVAGERRYRASQIAGLSKVPVIIRNHKELEELEIALVENVQRVDLSPLEQAISIVRLRDQFSLTPKQIAHKLGKAETTISNIVRLLRLPTEAVDALQKGTITEGHARAILSLKTDEKLQLELLNKIIIQKMSVREAEDFVQQNRPKKVDNHALSDDITRMLKVLDKSLAKATKIKTKQNGSGTMTVSFRTREELEAILNKLAG